VYGTVDIHSRISILSSYSVSRGWKKYWEAKHVSDGEVSLTLGSTSEVSLANCKILSNRSSPDFRYLPARDEVDRTMKHSSSELGMRGTLVAPLVLCALTIFHVGR
jgi:hypothetical protein